MIFFPMSTSILHLRPKRDLYKNTESSLHSSDHATCLKLKGSSKYNFYLPDHLSEDADMDLKC